jgi:hypothetical protein
MSKSPSSKPTRDAPDGDDYQLPGRKPGQTGSPGTPAPMVHRESGAPMVRTK